MKNHGENSRKTLRAGELEFQARSYAAYPPPIIDPAVVKRRRLLKVIVVGDPRVGKTQLIQHYTERKFSEKWKATFGADFLVKEVLVGGDTLVTLQIWDTPSNDQFKSLGTQYCRGADACVLM